MRRRYPIAFRPNLVFVFLLVAGANIGFAQTANPSMPDGFRAELIYQVPQPQGSWVSLTSDSKGRLIASDQYGKLYRIDVSGSQPAVEPINLRIGRAQGLLYAFDSLYVVAHGGDGMPAGLFRLQDRNGDDQFDFLEMLREFQGGGEHGPHAVILGPDKKSLYICAGNHTNLPNIDSSRMAQIWQEDQVLPRLPDANGHATGRMAPGGWICKTDPDGKKFELISSGYRNEYDIAFDPNGELFTYDADMEWDVGLPWYRPTRVCHVTSGSEFGWRFGTGKWPEYYPDSLPAAVDIGPGSPTGIVFGTGARFPAKYQNALFIADWSYGIIYAVHLQSDGASFRGEKEVFCAAPALPVTDLIVNSKDGAMYFLIGGRRSQSALYRVTYQGSESTDPATYPPETDQAKLRRQIEAAHSVDPKEMNLAELVKPLEHSDRFVRFAARTAIERATADRIAEQLVAAQNPQTILELSTALARTGNPGQQSAIIQACGRLDWDALSEQQRLHLLRNLGLVLARMKPANNPTVAYIQGLGNRFPAGKERVDRELSRLLVAVDAPGIVDKTMALLTADQSQHQQIHYALVLSSARKGWTDTTRSRYFAWFLEAATLHGGNSFGGYLRNIRQQAVDSMSDIDKRRYAQLLAQKPATNDPYAQLKARPVVKNWSMENIGTIDEAEFEERDLANGKKMFAVAACYKCHRINGQGGIVGPDLTPAGHRFNTRDLLETLIDPNKEVSDQYRATIFQLEDGRVITGRVVNLNGDTYMIQPDMIKPNEMVRIKVSQIEDMKPSTVSMMPAGLLDNLTREEILDLLAYLKSTSSLD